MPEPAEKPSLQCKRLSDNAVMRFRGQTVCVQTNQPELVLQEAVACLCITRGSTLHMCERNTGVSNLVILLLLLVILSHVN